MNNRATKLSAVGLAVGAVLGIGLAAPASAAPVPYPVDIVAHLTGPDGPFMFESSIPDCQAGWVDEGRSSAHFTPWGGVYTGLKVFTCDGDGAGFTVRLNARFGEGGSTGSWTFVDGWGFLEGVKGSGSLVGIPTEDGLDDHYTGSAR